MPAPAGLLGSLLSEAFDQYVKKLVDQAFGERWGYGDGKAVQQALTERATELLKTDPDLQNRIKTRLIGLIERDEGKDRR